MANAATAIEFFELLGFRKQHVVMIDGGLPARYMGMPDRTSATSLVSTGRDVGLSIFTYGTHYCSVDDRKNATTLACGMFNSGIRVFDIRDPLRPKEIAYYNPAGTTTASKGSNHLLANNWVAGGLDWCPAQVHLNEKDGTLWTTCQDNGVLVLKFTNDVWPLPGSNTPAGEQN